MTTLSINSKKPDILRYIIVKHKFIPVPHRLPSFPEDDLLEAWLRRDESSGP